MRPCHSLLLAPLPASRCTFALLYMLQVVEPKPSAPLAQVLKALCCWRVFLSKPNAADRPAYDDLLAMDMRPYQPLQGVTMEDIEVGAVGG